LPCKDGIIRTIKMGLENAKIRADQVDFVSAHATATKMGDVVEAQSIGSIYGDKPHVTGLKGYTGHTMGSCGVIETIMTLYMMEEGFIAPTLNLEEVDERCAMIRHTKTLLESEIRIAAVQNFAFGGVNTSLLFKKHA
ncbi:MAG TPA: 3-oxoacyl-ACP synthase, partial [Deltaproteobacteria bacterium]|nr:3-oxoacyl-ACP synthase [Deltaproteobacteria bacterium]